MVSVNGLSRFPSPAAKITAFFIMNLTGLYCLVLYLTFFFDVFVVICGQLNPRIYTLERFY
jgi:hypothetical protein